MIVSASYRTDIPAFYADWFRARLAAGWCEVRNPYGGKPYRVPLAAPDCDGFVFWTRNAAPFSAAFDDVAAAGLPFVVQFTVTGYPRPLDAHTPRPDVVVAQIRDLARRFGPRAVVWRYDPVLFTSLTPPARHRETVAELAASLAGSVDECVVSSAQIYRKTRRRLGRAAKTGQFDWKDPDIDEKSALLGDLQAILGGCGIEMTVCSQSELKTAGVEPAACIDAARLSDVAGRPLAARVKGNRPGCICAESRDIGAYDSCAHGCVYCYAVSDHAKAAAQAGTGVPG
jgi:hypothetical protein